MPVERFCTPGAPGGGLDPLLAEEPLTLLGLRRGWVPSLVWAEHSVSLIHSAYLCSLHLLRAIFDGGWRPFESSSGIDAHTS